ncbi:trypsin-like serine protease with C-terminal PDZ domain [Xenococcus sp. PCC 7305]|uniref:GUN4 domain-containing protein n=1 Tax=Xenococcus sp. PCC 7305 TaxID=102125 RepID=UPI0002AC522B|nr:GUN4 domain-containing protein [Xenococcus sp. PCC 7305]ELS05599.1 trypsin-like serine protease with C-terminal PDZ domain [Xenococcus sp. PCC 7305]
MNRYQKILIIIFGISLALIPDNVVTSAKEYQIVQALSSRQVNLRAKQITVRIDGDKSGSGIIIDSSNNKYTVLTSWHIVQELGDYIVQTVDGRQHQVSPDTIQRISDVDLAVFQFTSPQNYQIAELGNSNNLTEGQEIYFSGYPGELRTESDRVYRFFSANIVGLLDSPNDNGYSLIYDGSAFPGMSGGPVLNEQGRLIGIHGETNIHAVTGAVSNYAIPSSVYQSEIATNDEINNATTAVVPETVVETDTAQQPTTDSNSTATTTAKPESDNAAATPNNPAIATNDETNNATTAVVPETVVETDTAQQSTTDSNSTATTTAEPESDNAAATPNNPAIATNDETNDETNNATTAAVPETVVETDTAQQPTTDSNSTATTTAEPESDNAAATPNNPAIATNDETNNATTAVVPETIVETDTAQQPTTDSNSTAVVPETVVETNTNPQPAVEIDPSETNSVPVFSSPQNQVQNSQVATSGSLGKPEKNETTEEPANVPATTSGAIANSPTESSQANSSSDRKSSLISEQTGIDYTELQDLLAQGKWREADRLTKLDISNILQTIKRKNNNNPLELRTIADRACQDMLLIDSLWRKASGDRFGLRPQQNIWNSLNQNNNFSIDVWRNFVTEIGWKTGDINSAAGYILYEELDFNPQTAPSGHLPWWFDYSAEQKNIMRQVLTRCRF